MRREPRRLCRRPDAVRVIAALLLAAGLAIALVPANGLAQTRFDIYGFAMMDMGYQTGQNDPAWFDVLRPTKLPAYDKQFGEDGRFFASVRQSRFGVKAWIPTSAGEVKTIFEFELFGTGVVLYWFGYIEGIEPPEGITLFGRKLAEMNPICK